MSSLPGNPPPVLHAAFLALSQPRQEALLPHLVGTTSADYLADWLKRADAPVGATTIKGYRARLKECAA